MTTLSTQIGKLIKLLELSYNQLSNLPKEIRSLSKLNLSFNQFKLILLTNIEYLNISYNQIISLPSTLTKLCNLKYLLADNNPLTVSIDDICLMSILKCIRFENTLIKNISPNITLLTNLQNLSLSNLNFIPLKLFELTSITILHLHRYKIQTIPDQLFILINLRSLYLNNNQIENIPTHINRLTNLINLLFIIKS